MSELILVDESDREVGTASVLEGHSGDGILHRAFTIFIFNPRREILIQRRSAGKPLWPSTWETSCSGHQSKGEDAMAAGEKRLRQELGFEARLRTVGKFTYQARYLDVGAENEMCYVLVGEYDGEVRPDPAEVQEYRWTGADQLARAIEEKRDDYAPWLVVGLDFITAEPV